MGVAEITAYTALVATFFGGLIATLKYCIQLASLIKAHGELVTLLAAQLEAHSTLVPGKYHPLE